MSQLEFHEASNIFPLIEGNEFDDLVSDIKRNGQRVSIKIFGDKILDGRNRYRACLHASIEPKIEHVLSCDDPVAYVLSLNLHRRHLTPSQASMCAARARDVYEKQAKERQGKRNDLVENLPPSENTKARDAAGKAFNVSGKSVDHATRVITKGIPELAKAVDEGRMAVSTAAILATEPPDVQRAEIEAPKRNRTYTSLSKPPEEKAKTNDAMLGKSKGLRMVSSAMGYARMAISQLERIQPDDPGKVEAFDYVENRIRTMRNG